jgi:hypothetical protein
MKAAENLSWYYFGSTRLRLRKLNRTSTGLLPGRLLVHLHTPRIPRDGHASTSSLLESTLMTNITDIHSHNIELSHLCRNTAQNGCPR